MRARGVFWSDWNRRAVGENRSLPRAGLMARELGIQEPQAPILTVVGSKGKGTTATYASAYLLAAGMHTVTVTSPGLRGVRDRIRYDGRAIPDQQLTHLAERVNEALGRLPKHVPGIGYLSPSGLFIIAGVLYAEVMKANAIVLEAGMGGASDEVSLFQPTIVAITEIFGEHLGVLGDTPVEIAADKASVATAITKAVISLPQNDDVAEALRGTVTKRSDNHTSIEFIENGSSGVPSSLLAPSLGRRNSELGCVAAQQLLTACNHAAVPSERLSGVLASIVLPGRWSWHDVPGTTSRLFTDAAISRSGVAAALTEVYRCWDKIDHVLLCLPDHKDVSGAILELSDLPVTCVRLTDKPRLTFRHKLPPGWKTVDMGDIGIGFLADRGNQLVALGTGYFIARMLSLAAVDTECLFASPS